MGKTKIEKNKAQKDLKTRGQKNIEESEQEKIEARETEKIEAREQKNLKTNEEDYETIIHPLKPLFDQESIILILGSFPSIKTREYGFFYGYPYNRFWPIMERLFDKNLDTSIENRRKFLLQNSIAVYDSIFKCDIIGSSDASIKNVVPSDLSEIFQTADIKQVFCNGATSFKYYKKYHAKKVGIEGIKLPSTSPANARYRLDDLLEEWKVILEYLR